MEDYPHCVASACDWGGDFIVALLQQPTLIGIKDLDVIAEAMAPHWVMALLDLHAGEGELNSLALGHHQGEGDVLVDWVVERIIWRLHSSTCSTGTVAA